MSDLSFSSKVKQEIVNTKPKDKCEQRAYIRQAYQLAGTMVHPEKGYHMEFATDPLYKQRLTDAFIHFNLSPKEHHRKGVDILYFKESEQIATILAIMDTPKALFEFENCRVDKDMNNVINRTANAQAANADKVISASARHVRDIQDIQRIEGLSSLPLELVKVAQARLENPFAPLEVIGAELSPPLSKSGVNHRLRRIGEIAQQYRKRVGE
ncbi:MAG: DNA-binding protein WhiA [Defluviitaleaceae bacterium]|nr:DNA-binding protein WhiA [Defluviitaleaceae bacterium]